MMLSPKAKVDAIPSLIVETDSVSASHGGTVGEVDENQVFYMRSRGLSREEAVRVIVEGYFEPIVVQLDDEALEALVRARISKKLAAAAEDIQAYAAAR
jgi:Fe-S cluster assembly protein SufD